MQVVLFYLCLGHDPHKIDFAIVNNETQPNYPPYGSQMFINEIDNKTFDLVRAITIIIRYRKSINLIEYILSII